MFEQQSGLTLGSLFDGVGGWQIAAVRNGITSLWSSEIEKFCQAVTLKHFPDTIQLGDVNNLDGEKIPAVDIICAGSPCQDLSIAGKRGGLRGERSGLFFRAVDIVRQMRRATGKPRYFVWKMSQAHLIQAADLILEPCLKKSQKVKFQYLNLDAGQAQDWLEAESVKLRGECLTLNISEYRNAADESFLSQILQEDAPQKYYLSARACQGILRRAKAKGKEIPAELKAALMKQS